MVSTPKIAVICLKTSCCILMARLKSATDSPIHRSRRTPKESTTRKENHIRHAFTDHIGCITRIGAVTPTLILTYASNAAVLINGYTRGSLLSSMHRVFPTHRTLNWSKHEPRMCKQGWKVDGSEIPPQLVK